jgi:hypothetical protein
VHAELADELARARAEARILEAGPWYAEVTSVDEACRIQSLLAARFGNAVQGWKVTALNMSNSKAT